ncbi:hypothetical protein [Polynucleobacter sp. AP-Nino-20-G2]|uniref:hypothetical protein n=1 Tax=Polynucleobacter sp. AP-Nino-20-G2 TaxID=2576917 RepID=UPI001BFDDF97|nr:hypothetical protein [Polynucleobacter sp. AP-Nino-20-G2]
MNKVTAYALDARLERVACVNPESTHFAPMIYYRKTLFGCGPKLTAVQFDTAISIDRQLKRLLTINKFHSGDTQLQTAKPSTLPCSQGIYGPP